MMRVGIISDTHGLLRPEAAAALEGSDVIVHAGDIGRIEVIEALHAICPVTAIKGNIDTDLWADDFAEHAVLDVGDTRIYVIHSRKDLSLDPAAEGIHVVVSGHSHKPHVETVDDVLYINPGSAGPRRFSLPICIAKLTVEGRDLRAEIVELDIQKAITSTRQ